MESDITVFLEFYGLPGSGKSTISHLVAEELRKQNKMVIEPSYDVAHRQSESVRKVIKLLKLFRYAVFFPKRCKALRELIRKNKHTGLEVLSHAANIAQKLWVYDHAGVDYVIFDEGLTQSAISLTREDGDSSLNEKALYDFCRRRTVKKIYLEVTSETAENRMAGRAKHDSRIEKISGAPERKAAIREFETHCNNIRNQGIVINAVHKSPNDVANEILGMI